MHRFCKVLGHDYCLLAELCGGNIPLKRWKHTKGYCLEKPSTHTDPNQNIYAAQPARLVVLKSLKLSGFSIDLCSTIDKYRLFQPNFVVAPVAQIDMNSQSELLKDFFVMLTFLSFSVSPEIKTKH